MADLKPIGSEKLQGQEKIQRILEIARYNEVTPKNVNETNSTEYSITLADGNNYQIVKERSGYIIKKTITESETDYIEPMKNRKYYSSYSQAFKRLNLMAKEMNTLYENEEGISLFGEQKKFYLKNPKAEEPVASPAEAPAPPAEPPAVPQPELPPSDIEAGGDSPVPTDDLGGEEETGAEDMGAEQAPTEEGASYKMIQKLTGKLTQKIRDYDEVKGLTSEEIKYVVNMVLAAVNLKDLSDEDKEDILSKFEDDELSDEDMGGEDIDLGDDEDITSDTDVEDVQADMDVASEGEMGEEVTGAIFDSIFGESKVDKVLNKYFEYSDSEKKQIKEKRDIKNEIIKEAVGFKMESVKKLSETKEQAIASRKFLQENIEYQFIGITNKKNLIFKKGNSEVKISPKGIVK